MGGSVGEQPVEFLVNITAISHDKNQQDHLTIFQAVDDSEVAVPDSIRRRLIPEQLSCISWNGQLGERVDFFQQLNSELSFELFECLLYAVSHPYLVVHPCLLQACAMRLPN